MSKTLSAFMRSNVAPITNHFYAASPRFKVCARCTVFPDLNNAELQNDWGVAKPEELLGKMLIGGEFDDYMTEVFQVNGFKTEDELVDDAKN